MSQKLWKQIDEAALNAFRLSRRLEFIADKAWPPGAATRHKGNNALRDAAKDLLEALKALLSEVDARFLDRMDPLNVQAENARAVIVKAEGRS